MGATSFKNFASEDFLWVEGGPDGYKYPAAQMTYFRLRARTYFNTMVLRYLQTTWEYDPSIDSYKFEDRDDRIIFAGVHDFLLNQGIDILMADGHNELSVNSLVDLAYRDPDFVFRCYQAAVQQNPVLNPDLATAMENAQNVGEVTPETTATVEDIATFDDDLVNNN